MIGLASDGAGTLRAYAVLPPPAGTNIVGAVDLIVDVFGYFE